MLGVIGLIGTVAGIIPIQFVAYSNECCLVTYILNQTNLTKMTIKLNYKS